MKQEQKKAIIVNGNPIPVDDVVNYMASLAVINKYMRHAMTAGEKLEGGE